MWEDVAEKRSQKSSAQTVDMQRPAEVDEWWATHPKPQRGLEEHWYVCARPPCTYLWHFKHFTQYPLRKRQWRYIQTMSTEWMNELLCCFLPCTALVMNELKKIFLSRSLSNGLGTVMDLWFWAMELFSQKHKCIQCRPIFTTEKNKTGKHIKDLKMTNG